jgi:peptidoglycan/LPS O-acetylase OafA/YrhL
MLSAEHVKSIDRRGDGRRVMVGTAGAVVGVSACFFVASLTGASLMVAVRDMSATSVPFGAAVVATATAGGGAYVLARLARRASRPRRIFLLLTMAGLLASALPPLQAATTVSTAIWLLIMHAVAALVLVPVVAGGLPSVRRVGEAEVAPPVRIQVADSAVVDGNL